ncbi:hypothetical protein C8A05DRAFT_38727 [Staphylotrichum tortipilum]|uniref:Uncharacterized protein n=1 Tax=Staphylotrichum tortipilum TaxID=2831512 RepID=A0AAN6MD00_9PEZI|nr:hypothetical protein C8A05DRAFT_38727 [Staphylotrichum longicolle]
MHDDFLDADYYNDVEDHDEVERYLSEWPKPGGFLTGRPLWHVPDPEADYIYLLAS